MALQRTQSITENDGCKEWNFFETTGAYNDPDNLTGYGAPNATPGSMTSMVLTILPYGYTTGYVFNFTLVTGNVTAATVTAPDGTVTDIFADMEFTVFPFVEATPFVIISDWLGMGEDSELTSSAYYFESTAYTAEAVGYTASSDELLVCSICCCVRNASADLEGTDCKCHDDKIENAVRGEIYLDSALFAMDNGDVDKAYTSLMEAKKYCEGSCTNCG